MYTCLSCLFSIYFVLLFDCALFSPIVNSHEYPIDSRSCLIRRLMVSFVNKQYTALDWSVHLSTHLRDTQWVQGKHSSFVCLFVFVRERIFSDDDERICNLPIVRTMKNSFDNWLEQQMFRSVAFSWLQRNSRLKMENERWSCRQ
jgi:hypothetical protein